MDQGKKDGKFQLILKGIRQLIEEDQLLPGDQLPSERELSERLNAGRSTVREVLRALELLGLIETRRGEGTFLQPYHTHKLVKLLADYILRDNESKKDLIEMRILLELEAVRLAVKRASEKELKTLEQIIGRMKDWLNNGFIPHQQNDEFHHQVVRMSQNKLLLRTWFPVHQYFSLCMDREASISKWEQVVEELQMVIQAFYQKDPYLAYQRLQQHLEQFLTNSVNKV